MATEEFESNIEKLTLTRWEKRFYRIVTPFDHFVKRATTAGLLLMLTALIALILANTSFVEHYQHLLHLKFSVAIGEWELNKTLHHWVNDGLMALFFFVVGLELKREFLVGELAEPRKAVLPIVAAIGGMVVPALIYYLFNPSGVEARGWGIPMATDIAFALGVIALLASRVPKTLITFLVALAIVDDLGAVVVIALFYTEQLIWSYLLVAALLSGLLVLMNILGIRRHLMYFIVGLLLWIVLLKSGVHATLAGVITAFTIPAKSKFDPKIFIDRMRELMKRFEDKYKEEHSILKNQQLEAVVQTLENGVQGVQTPLQQLEHSMHNPVAYFILPVFALFNAGILIDFQNIPTLLTNSVTLGIIFGLLLGKFIGIAGFSYIALKFNFCSLPTGTSFMQLIGAAILGSIGFTMSIFIADLAFDKPEIILQAKLGILIASLFAGIVGYLLLYFLGNKKVESK